MLHSWAVMLRDQAEMVMKLSASLGAHRGSAAAEAAAGKKAKRDPLAPKKPMSSYFLFLKAEREKAQQDGTTPSGGDAYKAFTKALGEKWAALSEADKAPYNEEAARLKGAYADELDAYKSKRASAAPDAGSPADDGPQDVTDTVSVRGSDSAAGSPDGEEPERRAKKKLPSKKRSSDAGAERPTKRAHKEEPAVKKRLALPMNPKASSMSEASGSQ